MSKAERKFEQYPYADPEAHPLPKLRPIIAELLNYHEEVKAMKHPSQLKLSPWVSYYPATRTVFIDGEHAALHEMGIAEVIALLDERGELFPPGIDLF